MFYSIILLMCVHMLLYFFYTLKISRCSAAPQARRIRATKLFAEQQRSFVAGLVEGKPTGNHGFLVTSYI